MAGNLVKWWRHKILGGYKQFSAFNDCPTDSEELIYPIRAASSCSAPPDLLISAPDCEFMTDAKVSSKQKERRNCAKSADPDDRVRLEEFTCDVSLEDEKKPQPLQFSFTLYDLDGHGKITKDDIAGIVSTIYESIGKSVVVPHYGSKTINVRLTVSPDAKTRPAQQPKAQPEKRYHHRLRPKKLASDEDDSDTSESVHQKQHINRLSKDCSTTTTTNTTTTDSANEKKETLYANVEPRATHYCKVGGGPTDECCLIDMNSCTEIPKSGVNEGVICKDCNPCPFEVATQKMRKKQLRKSRSRKHKGGMEEVKMRARSLSVGNENCWKEENPGECWKSPLRRHELIEIIRESMEKNRLCFQANRKPVETPSKYRNRAHTVHSKVMGENGNEQLHPNSPVHSPTGTHHEANLCGYDSFLHATICSNAKNGVHLAAHPMVITAPNRLVHHHKNKLRTKHVSSRQVNQMKLSPSLLNQLNPNLTTEQKLTRTINQVEMWLERDQPKSNEMKVMKKMLAAETGEKVLNNSPQHQNANMNNNRAKIEKIRNEKPDMSKKIDNVLNADQLRITEEVAEMMSPKKASNKEASVATKKPIARSEGNSKPASVDSKGCVKEYATIPVNAEASECENLLRAAASDEEPPVDNTTSSGSTVHRYVHIHHHYHHFDETPTFEDA